MSVAGSVANGLHAAFLLARGRAEGLHFVSADGVGAGRSFWAMAIALPTIVALRLMMWSEAGMPPSGSRLLLRDLAIYAVSWLAFAVVSYRAAAALGRAQLWPRFIATWNWCNVAGNFLIMLGALPGLFGVTGVADQVAQVVMLGWAVWLEWYVVRLALGTGPLLAIYLVTLDQCIGLAFTVVGYTLGVR